MAIRHIHRDARSTGVMQHIRVLIYLLYISIDRPKQITAASIDHDNQKTSQEIFHLETEL